MALCGVMALLTLSSSSKPNIMLIVSDDQGYANIGYHNSTVLTPRINAIAKEGVILEGYYVQPVCSPTRSSLMSGRYTYRLGTQVSQCCSTGCAPRELGSPWGSLHRGCGWVAVILTCAQY